MADEPAAPTPAPLPPVAPPAPPFDTRVEVLRRIDLWSALKVSLLLYLCLFVVFLALATTAWVVARRGGTLSGLEGFIEEVAGYKPDTFRFKDGDILRFTAVVGPIFVVLAALATVGGVALFNLAARLSGGVEIGLRRR